MLFLCLFKNAELFKPLYAVKTKVKLSQIGGVNMSRVCNICGKGQTSGNNVSHSNRKTRRTFKANVQKVSYVENGKEVSGYVCTRCLKKADRA